MTEKVLHERDIDVCAEASKFTNLYYEAMDRKRDKINHLYVAVEPNLVWNGNNVNGQEDIFKFIQTLPQSDHSVQTVDAQRLASMSETSTLPEAIIMTIGGTVLMGPAQHGFVQNFILMREDGKFKVKSDRFRYID